jgi:predicted enzyme related to lactoylglutathione lyase
MLKKVAFTMYPVANLERAMNFYKKNFDLSPSKISANGAWVEYDLPGGGCFSITTLAEGVKPSENAGGSIAFEVDDINAVVSKLKANQVKIKLDIFSSPVCRMAVVLDSEGNMLMLHQLN